MSDVQALVKRGRAAQLAVDELLPRRPIAERLVDRKYDGALGSNAQRRKMNKLETRYAARLELERHAGLWLWWEYEPITFKLAADTRYTPDFALLDPGGHLVLHETKGFWRDDALVKIKVAARALSIFSI